MSLNYKHLNQAAVDLLMQVLTPWFLGESQGALIRMSDEVVDRAYDTLWPYIDTLNNTTAYLEGETATMVAVVLEVQEQLNDTVTGLQTALDSKAPLASPALTGTPTAPTALTGTDNTQIATTAFVTAALAENYTHSPFDQGNGFISWTGEAIVTSSTSVALLDSTGAALSPTKTYKVAACNIDSSVQRGAVALFVGDGSSFTRQVVYEAGLFSSNVRLYLNAGVPSVSVYGGAGSYRIPYRIEEVPNFGQALSEFGILQRLLDAPSDGTTYGRKDGAWVAAGGGGGIAWTVSAAATTLTAGSAQIVTAAVNKTLPASVSVGNEFIVHAKVTGVRIVSNGNVITGVGAGNNLTLAAGETARLIASATGVLEIV